MCHPDIWLQSENVRALRVNNHNRPTTSSDSLSPPDITYELGEYRASLNRLCSLSRGKMGVNSSCFVKDGTDALAVAGVQGWAIAMSAASG